MHTRQNSAFVALNSAFNTLKVITLTLSILMVASCGGGSGDINSLLPNAMSVEEGDRVRLNGVDVGKVTSFELESSGVRIGMDIDSDALKLIDGNATTSVQGGSNPYVVIKNPAVLSSPITRGSELSYAPASTAGLAGLGNIIGGDLGAALSGLFGNVQSSIEGQDWSQLNGALEKTMEDLTRNGSELGTALENSVGPILENFEGSLEELAPQIEAFSEELAQQFGDDSGELQSTIEGIMGELLNSMARGIEKGQQN